MPKYAVTSMKIGAQRLQNHKEEVHFQNTEEAPTLKWRAYQQESEKKNGFFAFKIRKF